MINWIFYPKSKRPPEIVFKVVSIFKEMADKIDSRSFDLKSNQVLGMVSTRLQELHKIAVCYCPFKNDRYFPRLILKHKAL